MTTAALPAVEPPALLRGPGDAAPPAPPLTLDAAAPRHSGPVPPLPGERRAKRVLFGAIAVAIGVVYLACVLTYWQPLHHGVDQNGYLVGGRQLATTLSMRQAPRQIGKPTEFDPHSFVANMWVAAANDPRDYFPKYPVGLPLVYAICLWVGGTDAHGLGVTLAYGVSPVAMALTVVGVFVLVRQFAGSFPAILAMLVFATSPTTGYLVNNPNSHAATVCCVVWGMVFVLHWWRFAGLAWAIAGGLLVGYATTIRYTEGVLVLPLAWAALMGGWGHVRHASERQGAPAPESAERPGRLSDQATRDLTDATRLTRAGRWRGAIEALALLVAWATPVALLVLHNLLEFGMITGYDGTSESVGFSWTFAAQNWETMLRQISENGLFLIFPVAVGGGITMFWWNWRLATFLWLWAAPPMAVYTFYYWAPDGIGYLRFLLTILPPLLVGAFWLMAHLRDLLPATDDRPRWQWMAPTLVAVAAVAAVTALYLPRIDKEAARALFKEGTWKVQSFAEYTVPVTTAYENASAAPAFVAAVVVVAVAATAAVAAMFLGRAVAPTLAGGVLACLSVAVQADNSGRQLERDAYDRAARIVAQDEILRLAPPGAVVICRDSSVLHPLQFVRDYYTYTGLTFDKAWVTALKESEGPDPIDINRVKLLKQNLAPYDQNALNEQALALVRDALAERRRVLVIESQRIGDRAGGLRQLAAGQTPDFVRRYVDRGKDKAYVARQISSISVEPPDDKPADARTARRRGRTDRTTPRPMAWQVWEITAKPG
jgi:hypothetical protein